MARFTTLYSGSSGNAGVVDEDGRFLLIDMGGSCRATVNGLLLAGLTPENLAGILVTHEHSDHIKGLQVFLKKYPVPLYSGIATLDALWRMSAVPEETEMIAVDGRSEEIAGFVVRGFATSHDAAGCCGFRITTPGGATMAIATDLGVMTADVYHHFREAALVALEANYDPVMLRTGSYPAYLKRRVSSSKGHLSNRDSASTVASLIADGCHRVALCHLSIENNLPSLVQKAVEEALFERGINLPAGCVVQVSHRHELSPWMEF